MGKQGIDRRLPSQRAIDVRNAIPRAKRKATVEEKQFFDLLKKICLVEQADRLYHLGLYFDWIHEHAMNYSSPNFARKAWKAILTSFWLLDGIEERDKFIEKVIDLAVVPKECLDKFDDGKAFLEIWWSAILDAFTHSWTQLDAVRKKKYLMLQRRVQKKMLSTLFDEGYLNEVINDAFLNCLQNSCFGDSLTSKSFSSADPELSLQTLNWINDNLFEYKADKNDNGIKLWINILVLIHKYTKTVSCSAIIKTRFKSEILVEIPQKLRPLYKKALKDLYLSETVPSKPKQEKKVKIKVEKTKKSRKERKTERKEAKEKSKKAKTERKEAKTNPKTNSK